MTWNAEDAVAKGAELLDDTVPGWAEAIEVQNLNMRQGTYRPDSGFASDRCGCIMAQVDYHLGAAYWIGNQLVGSYSHGLERVGVDVNYADDYGFDTPAETGEHRPTGWEKLTAAWIDEIERRRTAT